MMKVDHAAIVGGGFSGTFMAINLLRHGALAVMIIERHPDRLGRGLAYGAAHAEHILDVRAANMSALPDQPDHFVHWLQQEGLGQGNSFATRRDYGTYLCAMLDDMRGVAGERLTILNDEAIDATLEPGGVRLELRSGQIVAADSVIIAPGNLPPHDLPAFAGLRGPAYVRNASGANSCPPACSPASPTPSSSPSCPISMSSHSSMARGR